MFSMKKLLEVIAVLALSTLLFSCRKADLSPQNPTTDMAAARIRSPGVVYDPLNSVLSGNPKKVNQYTCTQSVDPDQDTVNDLSVSPSIINDLYGHFYHIGTSVTTIQAGGVVASAHYPSAFSGMAIGPIILVLNAPAWTSTYAYLNYFGARRGGAIIGKGDGLMGSKFVSHGNVYFG